jgi:hypothetical protein
MFVKKYGKSINYHVNGGGFYENVDIFGSMFQPSHNRWATRGKVFGSRKQCKVLK